MGELLEYINSNDKLTVSKPLPHVTTVRWKMTKKFYYMELLLKLICTVLLKLSEIFARNFRIHFILLNRQTVG